MQSEDEKRIAFQNETSRRVAQEERDTLRAKSAGAKLLRAVAAADPASLPADVRAAREELLKCAT